MKMRRAGIAYLIGGVVGGGVSGSKVGDCDFNVARPKENGDEYVGRESQEEKGRTRKEGGEERERI